MRLWKLLPRPNICEVATSPICNYVSSNPRVTVRILRKEKMKALLIIDIQNGLTKRKNLHEFSLFVNTINHSINRCRETGDLLVFIQHNNKKLQKNTEDWKIDNRVEKEDNELTIQKFHGNAFLETNIETILRKKNIDEIVVCGLVSNGCVKATCLGGLKLGFETALLKNGHTNWDKNAEIKKNLVETELIGRGVKVVEFKCITDVMNSRTIHSSVTNIQRNREEIVKTEN